MIRVATYNVNGIRSALGKGLIDWFQETNPDVLCLQEIKADESTFDVKPFEELGYQVRIFPAEKKGYSGVAIVTRLPILHVEYGIGNAVYDREGRGIRLDFEQFSVFSVYLPSGSSSEERQAFKMEMLSWFLPYIQLLKQQFPKLIIAGDFNICHKSIDIHDPIRNATSSGFLPEERAWMDQWVNAGLTDSFRFLNPETKDAYSWWTFRAGARGKNKGWRIDYQFVTEDLVDFLVSSCMHPHAVHSDHCPVVTDFQF